MKNTFNELSKKERLAILNFFIDTKVSLELELTPQSHTYLKKKYPEDYWFLFDGEKMTLTCRIANTTNPLVKVIRTKYYDQYSVYTPFPWHENSTPIKVEIPITHILKATILK